MSATITKGPGDYEASAPTGHPNDPRTLEAPEGYLERLIAKFYDDGANDFCTDQCPMFSKIRQTCMVLADGDPVDDCPKFESLCEDDRLRELAEWSGSCAL